jgi:hypothetical protein
MPAISPSVTGSDHGCQLVIEERVERSAIDEPEVDGGQLLDLEAGQIVHDALT